MPVRKTESRLPAGLAAPADLGQVASDPNGTLVSFLSTPVVVERIQHYAVFPAAGIVANVASYRWTLNNNGTVDTQNTTTGYLEYTPSQQGTLSVAVEMRNNADAPIATLTLQQNVLALNTQLEQLIDQEERSVPAAAHPAASREIINDLRAVIDGLAPPATENKLNRLLLSLAYTTALGTEQVRRYLQLEDQAALINNGRHADLLSRTETNGIGICKVRPQVLAMFLAKPGSGGPYIPITELPTNRRQRTAATTTIQTAFNGLTEEEKTDLFNRLRFPKSNVNMAKLVLTGLRDRYFNGQTFDQVLSDRTKARRLITHFENGPWQPAANGSISVSASSQRIFNLMSHQVWNVIPAGSPAAAGGAGGGPAPAPGGPVVVGAPEPIPDRTFVATPKENDNGFIQSAFLFHDTYGLNPAMVDSFEDLISRLSQQATPLNRIRIVSHFYLPPGTSQALPNMNMAFFTGAVSFTKAWHFKFGISDEEGLKAFVENNYPTRLTPGYFTNSMNLQFDPNDLDREEPGWKVIIRGLRTHNAGVLQPFNLDQRWPAAGDMTNLVKYCTDVFFLNNAPLEIADDANNPTVTLTTANAASRVSIVKTTFLTLIQGKINEIKPRLVNSSRTATQVDDLVAAISSFALANLPVPIPALGAYTLGFGDPVYLQDHTAFRNQLNTVRGRLSNTSFVDIRGCRVGQDQPYMQALKDFFSGGNRPTITAPEWFQSFPILGFIPATSETHIDTLFNRGFSMRYQPASGRAVTITINGADVQREYANWAGRIGIPAQVAFWNQVFQGDVLEFLTLRWKDHLPAIGMEADKLSGLSGLSYPDMITRLQEIFVIAAGSTPAAGVLQSFSTGIFPQVTALRDIELAIDRLGSGASVPDLQAQLALLQPIATAWSQTLPAAPNPLTFQYVQQAAGQLKQHAITQSQIQNFMQAVRTKLADPKSGFRYMLFIGLPLLVQSGQREPGLGLILLDALKDQALLSWTKIQWSGVVPANLNALSFSWSPPTTDIPNDPGTHNDDDLTDLGRALQAAALSNDRQETIFVINPMFEYQQHIKSL